MSVEIDSHVIDLLPEHALGILGEQDASHVSAHLAGCQTCQAELLRLQRVVDDLPLALSQTSPASRVKESLMKTIREQKEKGIPLEQPTFWQKLAGGLRINLPKLGWALILVLAVSNLFLWRQVNSSDIQASNPMLVFTLANTTTDAPRGVGTLIMDQEGHYGTLVVDKLPELGADQQYQVWLNQGTERFSAGLFSVNYDGYASLELTAPQPLILYDTIGVTVEPVGGSPGPTGEKVLGGELTQ